jgi:hypothetical protein
MHEQSETVQRSDGRWINVYGKALPQAGQPLPNSSDYGTVEEAVTAAKARSESFGKDQAMAELERRAQAGQLNPRAQEALAELKRRKGIETAPAPAPAPTDGPPQQVDSMLRPLGVAATGFNKGLAHWVDLINDGLKGLGLPMSDEPFMGSAFVDKYLTGEQFKPQNLMESVLHRAGLEVGANVPILAGTAAVQAGATAAKAADKMIPQTASTNWEAIKNIPKAMAEELTTISPAKLAAVESALAAGAGTGAEIVHSIFPEGGKTAEFVGELLGAFTPSVALGLVQKARGGVHALARTAIGLETDDEAKRRLGKELGKAATPEQVESGVTRAEELRKEVSPNAAPDEGLQLSAGSAIQGGEVTAVEKAEAKSSIKIGAKLKDQREQNLQEIERYFNETAPEGDPAKLVESLQARRAKNEALLKIGLDRTEMRVAAARGELSKRQAALQTDLENKMQAADQRLQARLKAIGPQLTPRERQDVIRSAYEEEVGKFRERSQADYRELDNLGPAELPVDNTISKLASLRDRDTGWPEQLEAIRKINPGVAKVIDNLGRDYELQQRATKAQADLEAVGGKGKDQRGGFTLFQETSGQGGTRDVTGVPSNYPYWYKSLANAKVKGGATGEEKPLDRETIEKALDTFKTGAKHGLHPETLEEVRKALMADSEFRKSPWFEPVMDELHGKPSASLKDLRHLRSDLLTFARDARSRGDRLQGYITHELVDAVDADIDRMLPGTSAYADLYPSHGPLYRQISADYRDGVKTLYRGQVGKLGQVSRDGSYRVDEAGVPALFWKDESSLEQFTKAFNTQADAKIALRDHAKDDLYLAAVKPIGGGKFAIDDAALDRWKQKNGAKLKAFPGLEDEFRNSVKLQQEFDQAAAEVKAVSSGRQADDALNKRLAAMARPGEFTPQRVSEAEARLNRVQDVVERTRTGWEMSKASRFLDRDVQTAANHILAGRGKEPLEAYQSVAKQLKGDPEALMGLNKAVWMSITDSMAPKLKTMTGQPSYGGWKRLFDDLLERHGPLMKEVLGPEGYGRIETAREVMEKLALGAKAGSDTSIVLSVHAALASTWLSRGWAALSGRVPVGFGFAERSMQYILKLIEKQTAAQQEEILLQAFHDPKVFQTLVNAAQYGPQNRLVQKQYRRHLHLLNMSEQRNEADE